MCVGKKMENQCRDDRAKKDFRKEEDTVKFHHLERSLQTLEEASLLGGCWTSQTGDEGWQRSGLGLWSLRWKVEARLENRKCPQITLPQNL